MRACVRACERASVRACERACVRAWTPRAMHKTLIAYLRGTCQRGEHENVSKRQPVVGLERPPGPSVDNHSTARPMAAILNVYTIQLVRM